MYSKKEYKFPIGSQGLPDYTLLWKSSKQPNSSEVLKEEEILDLLTSQETEEEELVSPKVRKKKLPKYTREENIEVFWSKVDKANDCWIWKGGKTRNYGVVHFQGKQWRTHRLSYYLTYGDIPEGMFVCHKCDNPSCVNSDHLFLGTPKDNFYDMVNKGRSSKLVNYLLEFKKE